MLTQLQSQMEEAVREDRQPTEDGITYYQMPDAIRQWAKTVRDKSDDMSLFCSAVEAQPFTSASFRKDPFRREPCTSDVDGDDVVTTVISEGDLPTSTPTLSQSIPDAQPMAATEISLGISDKENLYPDDAETSMSIDQVSDDIDGVTERQDQTHDNAVDGIFSGLCGYDDETLRRLHDWSLRHAVPDESLHELKGILQREVLMGVVDQVLEGLETVME